MKKFVPLFFLLALLFALSCKNKGYPKPKELLSEAEMVDVLYDMHLGEAIADHDRYNANDSLKIESEAVYQAVLNKHNINDSILARSIIYYSASPKVYEKIYEEVVERLNLKIEDFRTKQEIKVNPEQE
ncbi:DUF4296 domain-containing protein [Mangrovibacterium sp.]|uniref:DUF4296 domain-containing protein n=1 Tax=Mangrovibacterium sp. TaxID=1961364 RepID=UPI0035662BAA